MDFRNVYFPHDSPREIQADLIEKVKHAVENKRNLIAHAPTGLGKTAAVLSPALKYAVENDKVVFFLTSRHTQHKIAIDTLNKIKEKYGTNFVSVSIIGKKGLCLQPGVHTLYNNEFNEYCRAVREDKKCEFYENVKSKESLSVNAKSAISELKVLGQVTTDASLKIGERFSVCPYEISVNAGKSAKVIIGDYFYIFNPEISNNFFNKIEKDLENAIIIVDEAHNLPNRVKDLYTARLSTIMIKRAMTEAKKYSYDEVQHVLAKLLEILEELSNFHEDERYLRKEDFVERVSLIADYEQILADMTFVADAVREEQKQSYIGSVASFLESWLGPEKGFTRIVSKQESKVEQVIMLSYRCLDPSLTTRPIIERSHSTIIMSGTLNPVSMYKELLGVENVTLEQYKSPFPEENKLNLIIPKTTTKYEKRSPQNFTDMAKILADIVNAVPGNSAIFFPSYFLRDTVYKMFNDQCKKTVFIESPGLSKPEKHELLDKFKGYKNTGAVLLGVTSGSFAEGIDLPGDFLKCVVIVGLPLTRPDLETKALINYYDREFGRGWDYGYLYPAFNKVLQSAGRCIRSETDKGIIIFLDERYTWSNYYRCFPEDWSMKTTMLYEKMINEFFNK